MKVQSTVSSKKQAKFDVKLASGSYILQSNRKAYCGLLWFLTVLAVCVYTLVHLLC